MKTTLSNFQKAYGEHRLMFGTEFLSSDVAESLRRASLACAENQKKQTGIIDLFCGLYLHNRGEIVPYFKGDFAAVVTRNFPVHRFGPQGLVPQVMLDQAASEDDSCSLGFGYSINYTDELQRLLWLSARLAKAIGKNASIKDVVAAFTFNQDWIRELAEGGLLIHHGLPDFAAEVETVIFHATPHTTEGWLARCADCIGEGELIGLEQS
ncbi:MAG: hypothetical protein JSS69_09850 [Acidobacteria bacterium]|nr:hypothetical protein [Acidobacteriota bacterium]MBS1866205.1 hypothetical protein [Acidobacteriota bacterium]